MTEQRRSILALATEASADLETIRRRLRDSIAAEVQKLSVPLTAPQVSALALLVDERRDSGSGISLSELSRRMGLSHSTVSGIVDRLVRRGLVERRPRSDDRRFTEIELTADVERWLKDDLPAWRVRPLADALSRASRSDRATILAGLATLARLLDGEEQ